MEIASIFQQKECVDGKGFCADMVRELESEKSFMLFLNISKANKTGNPLAGCNVVHNLDPLLICPFCGGSL